MTTRSEVLAHQIVTVFIGMLSLTPDERAEIILAAERHEEEMISALTGRRIPMGSEELARVLLTAAREANSKDAARGGAS